MQQISLTELQIKLWHFNTLPADALGKTGKIKTGQAAVIKRQKMTPAVFSFSSSSESCAPIHTKY